MNDFRYFIINYEQNKVILGLRKQMERFGRRKKSPRFIYLFIFFWLSYCLKRAEGNWLLFPGITQDQDSVFSYVST